MNVLDSIDNLQQTRLMLNEQIESLQRSIHAAEKEIGRRINGLGRLQSEFDRAFNAVEHINDALTILRGAPPLGVPVLDTPHPEYIRWEGEGGAVHPASIH